MTIYWGNLINLTWQFGVRAERNQDTVTYLSVIFRCKCP